jgi:hypothetical protein
MLAEVTPTTATNTTATRIDLIVLINRFEIYNSICL